MSNTILAFNKKRCIVCTESEVFEMSDCLSLPPTDGGLIRAHIVATEGQQWLGVERDFSDTHLRILFDASPSDYHTWLDEAKVWHAGLATH